VSSPSKHGYESGRLLEHVSKIGLTRAAQGLGAGVFGGFRAQSVYFRFEFRDPRMQTIDFRRSRRAPEFIELSPYHVS
jgi:hypothetical protein